jgi:hypothetical protein
MSGSTTLLQALRIDLRLVGALEHVLVEQIAGVLWRKQCMEGAEQTTLATVQLRPVTDGEIKDALALEWENHPSWMYKQCDFGLSLMKPLPNWMLAPEALPNQKEGELAVKLTIEWNGPDSEFNVENEETAQRHCPLHWAKLATKAKELNVQGDHALALKLLYNPDRFKEGFQAYMSDRQQDYYWVAYCHRNRQRIEATFHAIYARRMIQQWDSEKAHRYTTMFDNQLFKLLREYRSMQAWWLSQLAMVDEVEPAASVNEGALVEEVWPTARKKR